MNCIFCNIVEKKAHAEILYEDNETLVLLDIAPLNYGHTLVIPKEHHENLLEVPTELLQRMILVLQDTADSVKSAVNADGFNIIVNTGRAAGQTIFHFHFHIIPRYKDDRVAKLQLKSYAEGEFKKYADKIRLVINNKVKKNG